ncbi:uncharacterized protein LOC124711915 [Schistocerca piceifrons]|uniref:uncharacterized protein LOC124711915 n=1 Tax=Schistocerca piceifrons TaxID=274613 RepID=UPI001F5FA7F5|nr:uncharacterized protein LOC124711915 [Schistocerca piceifrons]
MPLAVAFTCALLLWSPVPGELSPQRPAEQTGPSEPGERAGTNGRIVYAGVPESAGAPARRRSDTWYRVDEAALRRVHLLHDGDFLMPADDADAPGEPRRFSVPEQWLTVPDMEQPPSGV